jgi:hypothetical protein
MTGHRWKRSSFCGGGGNNCVEVAADDTGSDIAIRNSARPQHVITVGRPAFVSLVGHLRSDVTSGN